MIPYKMEVVVFVMLIVLLAKKFEQKSISSSQPVLHQTLQSGLMGRVKC